MEEPHTARQWVSDRTNDNETSHIRTATHRNLAFPRPLRRDGRRPSPTSNATPRRRAVTLQITLLSRNNRSPVSTGFRPKILTTYSQPSLCLAFAFGTRSIVSGVSQSKKKISLGEKSWGTPETACPNESRTQPLSSRSTCGIPTGAAVAEPDLVPCASCQSTAR
jgi:hypothetical protein